MADWAADVKKYAPHADDAVIAKVVRHCGIALQKADSSLVSFSDKAELDRVKKGFMTKKLEITDNQKRLQSKFEAMSDEDLMKVIEGEASVVDE